MNFIRLLVFAASIAAFSVRADDLDASSLLDTSLFTYRIPITVSGYVGESTLEDFPVLVKLAEGEPSDFSYADCAADGSDLRFTDAEGNLIAHEIESWNAAGESFVWVKLPRLSKENTRFSLYYCTNGDSTLPEVAASSVWSKYAVVVHGGSSLANAVDNGLAVTAGSQYVSGSMSAGIAGGGVAKSNYKSIGLNVANPSSKLGHSGQFTVSGWFRREGKGGKDNNGTHILMASQSGWNKVVGFLVIQEVGKYISVAYKGGHSWTEDGPELADMTWGHVAFAYDKPNKKLASFFDGNPDRTIDDPNDLVNTEVPYWTFGSYANLASDDSFKGSMDELRVFNGVASADWIKAEHDTVANPVSFANLGRAIMADASAPVIGMRDATVSGNDVLFSVCIDSLKSPASVSVFYRAEVDPSFTELPLGDAIEDGVTLTASIPSLGAGAYVWYVQAVSEIDGIEHSACTKLQKSVVVSAKDPVAAYKHIKATIAYNGTPASGVPVLVRLSEAGIAGFDYDDVTESGFEFVDESGNILPHEIDTWDTDGTSYIWVLPPVFADGVELTIRYGTDFSNPGFPASEVWTKYVGVWHMNKILDDPVTGKHYTPDSSASGWHAYKTVEGDSLPAPVVTATGATSHPKPITGMAMDIAYDTKTSSDLGGFVVPASLTSSMTLNGPGFTLSAIANSHQIANEGRCRAVAFGNSYKDKANLAIGNDNIYCMGTGDNSSHNKPHSKGSKGWVCATAVFGSKSFIYSDGVNISGAGGNPNLTELVLDKGIGLGCFADGKQCLNGYLDEVRIRNDASTADYIAAEYAAMADDTAVSFSRVTVIDATTPVLSDPIVVRNQDGSFTVKVSVSGNVPASVACDIGGERYFMSTSDTGFPMSYSVTVSGLAPGTYVPTVTAVSATGNPAYVDCMVAFHAGSLAVSVISDADEGSLAPGVFRVSRADADVADLPELTIDVEFSGSGLEAVAELPAAATFTIPAGAAYIDLPVTPVYTTAVAEDTTIAVSVSGPLIGQSSSATLTVVNADYDPEVRYVATDGNDANHGGTVDMPKKTIAAAVTSLANVARSRTCTVNVAEGLYKISSPIVIANPIRIIGGDPDPSRTVVLNITDANYYSQDCRVFKINHAEAIVSSLTMRNGQCYGNGGNFNIGAAGGIVSNCVVETGYTRDNGKAGGGWLDAGVVTHTIFRLNYTRSDSVWWNGVVEGVLHLGGSSCAANCLFDNNSQYCAATLVSVGNGAVLRNSSIVNSRLSKTNEAFSVWSALKIDSGATVQNVVLAGVTNNEGVACSPMGTVTRFLNGAFDGDVAGLPEGTVSGSKFSFFKDYANGDYVPKTGGPLVNAGADYDGMSATDLAGKARKIGKGVDIGCYEGSANGMFIYFR